jgi:hypothetical protein
MSLSAGMSIPVEVCAIPISQAEAAGRLFHVALVKPALLRSWFSKAPWNLVKYTSIDPSDACPFV